MNRYQDTLDFLYSQLPVYHRIGPAAYKADINNTLALCELLNHPYKNFKSIHIAGTNGKGSTSHTLASILQEQGYTTGLYTSPHLKDFTERIKVNGHNIDKEYVCDFIDQYKQDFLTIGLSFFEMSVGLAFQYFADMKVDIAVIETGLGGRLDSTNVINPLISVITNISFDHTNLLGDSLDKIAFEKAGIIKKEIPCVIGEYHEQTWPVFKEKAKQQHAPIYLAEKYYSVTQAEVIHKDASYRHITVNDIDNKVNLTYDYGLTGNYQDKNLITVLKTIDVLKDGGWAIGKEAIFKGIKNVIPNTGLMGRWQILNSSPLTICDVGHNEDGIKYLIAQIKQINYKNLHFVLGMVNDKNIEAVLQLLPEDAVYYFCKAAIPRGLDAELLKEQATSYHLKGDVYPSVAAAYQAAQNNAGKNDFIFIGGSTFVVAEVI